MINTKEQTVINSIKDMLEGENIQTQYSVLGYRIDLYCHEYKLVIEVHELGDTNFYNETERQKALVVYLLELHLMKKIINKIHRQIKTFLIDKI